MSKELLLEQEQLLVETEALIEQQGLLKARQSFADFCETVVKDEYTGEGIVLAPLHKTWIHHIGFCIKNDLNALILAPMSCHTAGQGVLMYDGSIKKVEDIVIGDVLMGPDSTSRHVLKTLSGLQETFDFIPHKGSTQVVSRHHKIVTIRRNGLNEKRTNEIKEYSIDELVNRKWIFPFQVMYSRVEFKPQKVPIDPYLLGLMLGDGCFNGQAEFISADKELLDYVEAYCVDNAINHKIVNKEKYSRVLFRADIGQQYKHNLKGDRDNIFIKEINKLGLKGTKAATKFVPTIYKINDRETRLQILAGLLDTDGNLNRNGNFDYISKSKQLAEDICYIARSLGLWSSINESYKYAANTIDKTKRLYYRVLIGGDLTIVPTKLQRKIRRQAVTKDCTRTGFKIKERNKIEQVYAFTLNKDGRYLSDEFMILKNSGKCISPETNIITDEGLLQARFIAKGMGILAFDEKTSTTQWSTVKEVDEYEKDVVKISTNYKDIIVSLDHPFWNGEEWVEAQDLRPNKDKIFVSLGWTNTKYEKITDCNEAYLLGILMARAESQDFHLKFENVEIITKWAEGKKIDFSPNLYSINQKYRKKFYQEAIKNYYSKEDGEITISIEDVFNSSLEVRNYFISAVFDVIGEYDFRNKQIRFNTYTKEFAEKLGYVLESLGFLFVVQRRSTAFVTSFYLVADRLLNDEFFRLPINPTRYLGRLKFTISGHPTKRVLPVLVTAVKQLPQQTVVGIEVEKFNTFISNGLISHNTQIMSVALPLYLIGKNTSTRIKIVCLSDEAAKERVTSIRGYIEHDPDYHNVFPEVYPGDKTEWTKHKLVVNRRTFAKDATVDAKGIISSGIGGRCDFLIVDDIFDQRTAVSQPSTREQYLATYTQVWLSRVEPGGSVVVICTRWHERDLAGYVMADKVMLNRYGVLIQSVSEDFTGIECRAIVPNELRDEYKKTSKTPFNFAGLE